MKRWGCRQSEADSERVGVTAISRPGVALLLFSRLFFSSRVDCEPSTCVCGVCACVRACYAFVYCIIYSARDPSSSLAHN
ncbi:hypothetical protein T492DRAFT_1032132 [Pavlovales sp. CCMP2436]|nr:hypothetical protein T492DRAFT_1032132 [Pavlovales sp. CCMP2436]